MLPKKRSTFSKQHSTLLLTATMSNEFIVKVRFFDKVGCCFDIVVFFGNNVERFFRKILSFRQCQNKLNMFKQIEHVQVVSTRNKLNMFDLFGLCRKDEILYIVAKKRQQCRSNVRLCRSNIRFCRKNRSTCIAFHNVASTLLLVLTGL